MRQWARYSYLQIAEIKNEWMRQWARTVLIVERTIPPAERLKQQNRFHLFFFFFTIIISSTSYVLSRDDNFNLKFNGGGGDFSVLWNLIFSIPFLYS